ncbi:MAG: hypothetical protein KatS3mg132_689 [Limisphaera sp.]|nr:MAG: hypothetical protein KatS3mg132_689 [Limisphaera sp.]
MKTFLVSCALLAMLVALSSQQPRAEVRIREGKSTLVHEYYVSNMLVKLEGVSVRTNKDGIPLIRFRELYREGKRVSREVWGPGEVRDITFYREGKPVLQQVDKDGDGRPEVTIVTKEDGVPEAVLSHDHANGVELVGETVIEQTRLWHQVTSSIVKLLSDSGGKPEAAEEKGQAGE